MLLATRDWGERVTTRGVTATLGGVPGHPGSVAAGKDALWVALVDAKRPVTKQPILRLDLSSKTLRSPVDLEGQATYLLHAGDRLLASVAHPGSNGSGPSRIVALDWRTGELQMSTQFRGAVGPLVQSGTDMWALQTQPGELVRLNAADPGAECSSGRAPARAQPRAGRGRRVRVGLRIRCGRAAANRPGHAQDHRASRRRVSDGDRLRRRQRLVRRPRTRHGRSHRAANAPADRQTDSGRYASRVRSRWRGDYLFVGRAGPGTVTRIDVRSGRKVGVPIRFGPPAKGAFEVALAPSGASVWTSSFASSTLTQISSTAAGAPARAATVSKGRQTNSSHGKLPRAARVAAEISHSVGKRRARDRGRRGLDPE